MVLKFHNFYDVKVIYYQAKWTVKPLLFALCPLSVGNSRILRDAWMIDLKPKIFSLYRAEHCVWDLCDQLLLLREFSGKEKNSKIHLAQTTLLQPLFRLFGFFSKEITTGLIQIVCL